MVKVYAVVLAIGFLGLVAILFSGTLAENTSSPKRDLNQRIGPKGRSLVGLILGFGMGGMAAEFSPLDLSWQVALALAGVGGLVGLAWVRFSERIAADR